jgi:sugar phosphate isomerase/epimerase
MGSIPFALQLYTVRDHLEKDFPGTLKRVKEIGYDYVETAGFGPYSPGDCRKALEDAGLTPISCHIGCNEVCEEPESVVDTMQSLGVKHAAISASAEDKAGWAEIAKGLDAGGAVIREAALTLCYHNHAHEFEKIDGQYVLDFLYENTDPSHLAAQIDTYWVKYGGEDPVAVIRKYAGRCPLLHIKDMVADESRTFAEVGQGIIEWTPVFAAGAEAGAEWYIVEQDTCASDSIESARISADFMATH